MKIRDDICFWCQGRAWIGRAVLLCIFVGLGICYLFDPTFWSVISPVNLMIHESGHFIFGFAGVTLAILGGTLMQLLIPLVFGGYFLFQPDYFAACFCSVWFSMNLYESATYIADARAQALPLLGGDGSTHDWHFLLSQMFLLPYDTAIANGIRVVAFIIFWSSLAFGAWMVWEMAWSQGKKK
ncbi:hypothetical protein ACFL49_00535 [Candidatus Omnitrophota bacterium]